MNLVHMKYIHINKIPMNAVHNKGFNMIGYRNKNSEDLVKQRSQRLHVLLKDRDYGGGQGQQGSTGTGGTSKWIGTGYNALQGAPTKLSPQALQILKNQAASRAAAGSQGAAERIRSNAARMGYSGSGAELSQLAAADRSAQANINNAIGTATLQNEQMGVENALRKAQGLGNYALSAEGLRQADERSRASELGQMERFYQGLMNQIDEQGKSEIWRDYVYGNQLERQGELDDRYLDERGRAWDIEDKQMQQEEDERAFYERLRNFVLRKRMPEFYEPQNSRLPGLSSASLRALLG
jgi:hypothetical protein